MYPLAELFNLSLTTKTLPSIWTCARVTPVFKGGDPTDVNYKPISIMCAVQKILEKNIFTQISSFVDKYNILCPNQSGFW